MLIGIVALASFFVGFVGALCVFSLAIMKENDSDVLNKNEW